MQKLTKLTSVGEILSDIVTTDGKVDLEVVAAAASYLKDAFDKEGIQERICNHSRKYLRGLA